MIEAHYGRSMDIEWAKDGLSNEIFIVQARPETVHAAKPGTTFDIYKLQGKGERLVEGVAIGSAIVSGKACIVQNPEDIERFEDGAILVAQATNPDWPC